MPRAVLHQTTHLCALARVHLLVMATHASLATALHLWLSSLLYVPYILVTIIGMIVIRARMILIIILK